MSSGSSRLHLLVSTVSFSFLGPFSVHGVSTQTHPAVTQSRRPAEIGDRMIFFAIVFHPFIRAAIVSIHRGSPEIVRRSSNATRICPLIIPKGWPIIAQRFNAVSTLGPDGGERVGAVDYPTASSVCNA